MPDFVVVLCPDSSCRENIVSILKIECATALAILQYEEWLEDAHMLKYNLLLVRPDGSWLYAKDALVREIIKKEVQSIHNAMPRADMATENV